jgi:STE24 endopeptidase
MMSSAFDLALLLGFWALDGFERLDSLIVRVLPESPAWLHSEITLGVLFLGVLFLAKMLISLPFQLYSTFVIEERFGFNKTTPGTFVADLFKGLAIAALLGIPATAAVLGFFYWGGERAWLYAWVAGALFVVAVQYVVPTWIMPLFNRFTPLPDGELRERLMALARTLEFPLQEVFVIDGSKRSSKANAFFTGFGKRKRIALFDTLLESQTTDEVLAVLAHEVGHFKRGHIKKGLVLGLLHMGAMLFLLGVLLQHQGLYEAFGVPEKKLYIGMVLFGLLMAPIDLLLSLFFNRLSRKHEFEADRFAVEAVDDGESLVSALKKLSVDHLANLTPHPLMVTLGYSHPPVLERIEAIRRVSG